MDFLSHLINKKTFTSSIIEKSIFISSVIDVAVVNKQVSNSTKENNRREAENSIRIRSPPFDFIFHNFCIFGFPCFFTLLVTRISIAQTLSPLQSAKSAKYKSFKYRCACCRCFLLCFILHEFLH